MTVFDGLWSNVLAVWIGCLDISTGSYLATGRMNTLTIEAGWPVGLVNGTMHQALTNKTYGYDFRHENIR